MLDIFYPHCGELHSEEEFHAKGQTHIPRSPGPSAYSDEEWGNYMFFRDNPHGLHHELWVHTVGCRKYFNVTRHVMTYETFEVYLINEQPSVVADGKKKPVMQGEPA